MQNINPLDGEKRYSIISKNKMGKRLTTKHSASKKGFAHKHNLSKGQMKDAAKVGK
mgnify:CR=1 FL=1